MSSSSRRLISGLTILSLVASIPVVAAREATSLTDEHRAEFVYKFMQFVDWPEDAFRTAAEPLRVELVGGDPFNGSLDRVLADKRVKNRAVVITRVTVPTVTPLPQVAVIAGSVDKRLASVLATYCRAPVLTVSDMDRFAERGGVMSLLLRDGALRFAINRTAAEEARLYLNAQLLHLAVPLYSAISPCGA